MYPRNTATPLLPGSLGSSLRKGLSGRFYFRAAVSTGILLLLFRVLPLDDIFAGINAVPVSVWLLTLLGFAFGHVIAALKWQLLLRVTGVYTSRVLVLKAHAAGLFANLCLPSIVGGDFIRAAIVTRSEGGVEKVAVASLADRLIDTLVLLVIAVVATMLLPEEILQANTDYAQSLSLVVTLSFLLLLFVVASIVFFSVLSESVYPRKIRGVAVKIRLASRSLASAPLKSIIALLFSLFIQAGFIFLNVLLAKSIGISVPLLVWFMVWPLAKLIALVPVSLGGIGVRDAALMALLLPFGVSGSTAIAQSLSWQAVLWATGLFAGALVFLMPNLLKQFSCKK